MSDDNELGLLVLNESGDVVKTELKDNGLLGLDLLSFSLGDSGSNGSDLLFSNSLGSVLAQELQQVSRVVLVEGLGELVDLRRHLESLEEHSFLSLESNVSGPSHESGQISLGLDITTNSEVSGF